MIGFTFRGKHSSEFNIGCKSIDRTAIPERRRLEMVIPRRSGTRELPSDIYDKRTIEIEIGALFEEDFENFRLRIRELAYWLSGTGELTFDDEKDKSYQASVYDFVGLEQIQVQPKGLFNISFDCQPFAMSEPKTIAIQNGVNLIDYKGTVKSPTKILIENTSTTSAVNITVKAIKSRMR